MVTPSQLNRRAALFEQLATMIAAGVPLPKAMEMVARNRNTGVPQRILQRLSAHLNDGHTFTDSMLLVSGQKRAGADGAPKRVNSAYALSDFDTALLTAGEQSGRLDASFKLLGRYYASRARIIRDTLSGSLISMVTLHVALLVFPIGLLQQFALGIIYGPYSNCIPFILEKLAVFGVLYAAAWFLAFSAQGNRGESWRSMVQSITGIVPLLGAALRYLAVARLAMALDALLNAGVPVVHSWQLAANASGSLELKREVARWVPELETGATPAEMVGKIKYFPDMFAQLYQTGELSGRMDESLAHLQSYFEDEGFRKLQYFTRILMFVIYFGVAAGVGLFVIRFYMGQFASALNAF